MLDFSVTPQFNTTSFLMSAASMSSVGSLIHHLDIWWDEDWKGASVAGLDVVISLWAWVPVVLCQDTWMLMSLLCYHGSWANVEPPLVCSCSTWSSDSLTLPLLIVLPFLTTIRPQLPCQKEMPLSSHLCFMMIWLVQHSSGDNSLPWYMSCLMVAWGFGFFSWLRRQPLFFVMGIFI